MVKDGKSSAAHKLSAVMRVAVALGALIWVFHDQDWRHLAAIFAKMNFGYFLLSLAVYTFTQFLMAFRWWLLMRALRIDTGLSAAIRLIFLGLFYNNVMPGSVGGDLLKAWYVTKHASTKKVEAVLSVFVDRIIGIAGIIAIAACSYGLFMRGERTVPRDSAVGGSSASGDGWATVWLALAMAVVLGALAISKPGRAGIRRLWTYLHTHGLHVLGRLRQALVLYCRKPMTLLAAFGLTLVIQGLVIVAFWLLGRNIGVEASAKHYFVYFPIAWLVAALPISVAGVGILEGGIRELFTRFAGASAEKVLALALCQRFVWVLSSLPGALIHLVGAHVPKDFSVDDEKLSS